MFLDLIVLSIIENIHDFRILFVTKFAVWADYLKICIKCCYRFLLPEHWIIFMLS